MRPIKQILASSALVALGLLSSAAQAALSQYSITSSLTPGNQPIGNFTPQATDVFQGTFSYLSSDTALGSATQTVRGRYSTTYVYEMPSAARIDFTIGGHAFSSDKVSLIVSKSDWVEAGPDWVAVVGQNLTMDGAALSAGLVGFQFQYPVGTFANGLPPQTLQLNAPVPKGSGQPWTGFGYIVEGGGYALSTILAGGSSTIGATLTTQSLSLVPEPGTWALMLLGLGAVGAGSMRQPKKPQRAVG